MYNKFSTRETLIILIPGVFFVYYFQQLLKVLEFKIAMETTFENSVLFIIVSIIFGIFIHAFDFPKKHPLFKKYLPFNILLKDFPNAEKTLLKNLFFNYYDGLSPEFKEKTNIYTSIFHLCINIAVPSSILSITFLFYFFFNRSDIILNHSISLLILSIILWSSGYLVFKNKILSMFNRALKGFQTSKEFEKLH